MALYHLFFPFINWIVEKTIQFHVSDQIFRIISVKYASYKCIMLTFVLFSIPQINANKEEKIEMIKNFAQHCFGKNETTEEDFDNMVKNKNIPDTRGAKCLIACMQKQLEIVRKLLLNIIFDIHVCDKICSLFFCTQIKDGEFQKDVFIALIKSKYYFSLLNYTVISGQINLKFLLGAAPDDTKYKIIEEAVAACEHIKNPDECELAAEMAKCCAEEGKKRGIDFNQIHEDQSNHSVYF